MQLAAGQALVCRPLEPHARHVFTTRGWQLGSASTPAEDAWRDVAGAIDVSPSQLVRVHQVHGASAVVFHDKERLPGRDEPLAEADIVLSDAGGPAVAIQTADCLPLLIADRRTGAVAAAHAGWRGLALSVPVVAIERLATEFGSRPPDLVVAIGPAIGACCYEVGEDVRRRFQEAAFGMPQLSRWFMPHPARLPGNPPMSSLSPARRAGHWFFDGVQAARDQLASAGVPTDQVFDAGLCTASHAGVFCSYRRDGTGAGRMAATIRRQPRP